MLGLNILLPFAFFAIVNALPPAGTYNIISRIMSPTGQQLAVTFNGEGAAVTLEPLATTDLAQIVSIQLLLYVRIKTFNMYPTLLVELASRNVGGNVLRSSG